MTFQMALGHQRRRDPSEAAAGEKADLIAAYAAEHARGHGMQRLPYQLWRTLVPLIQVDLFKSLDITGEVSGNEDRSPRLGSERSRPSRGAWTSHRCRKRDLARS